MTPDQLDALDKLAAAATPGPWHVSTDRSDDDLGACVDVEGPTVADDDYPFIVAPNVELRDARLIAALDPATVRSLIARVRTGERLLAEAEHALSLWVRDASDSLDRAWEAAEAALPEGLRQRAISIAQYDADTGSAGKWVALVVWAPDFFGDGPTPAAALTALAAALRTPEPVKP